MAMEAPRSHLVRPLQAVHYLGCLKSEEKRLRPAGTENPWALQAPHSGIRHRCMFLV